METLSKKHRFEPAASLKLISVTYPYMLRLWSSVLNPLSPGGKLHAPSVNVHA